jgi:hypothetical protein
MIFRVLSALMTALFAVATVVQYDDPDPGRWMAIYGAACATSSLVAARGQVPVLPAIAIGVVALGWGLVTGIDVPIGAYGSLFDAWEMQSKAAEEAREASGLLIVAAWMALVVARGTSRARSV